MLRLTVEFFNANSKGGRCCTILSQYWIMNHSTSFDRTQADYLVEDSQGKEVFLLKDFKRQLGHMELVSRISKHLAPKFRDNRWK